MNIKEIQNLVEELRQNPSQEKALELNLAIIDYGKEQYLSAVNFIEKQLTVKNLEKGHTR